MNYTLLYLLPSFTVGMSFPSEHASSLFFSRLLFTYVHLYTSAWQPHHEPSRQASSTGTKLGEHIQRLRAGGVRTSSYENTDDIPFLFHKPKDMLPTCKYGV